MTGRMTSATGWSRPRETTTTVVPVWICRGDALRGGPLPTNAERTAGETTLSKETDGNTAPTKAEINQQRGGK